MQMSESRRPGAILSMALRQGHYYPWDYKPLQMASERYMRNHLDLNVWNRQKV